MHKKKSQSEILHLATQKPSIFYHITKLGLLPEIALRLGWSIDEDDRHFIDSFAPTGESEIYTGTYQDQHITVDATSGDVFYELERRNKKSASA